MACFFLNSATLLDAPTDSRKTWASKAFFSLGFMPDGGTFLNIVLVAIYPPFEHKGTHCSLWRRLAVAREEDCPKKHSPPFFR
jgi:hypothetical protein